MKLKFREIQRYTGYPSGNRILVMCPKNNKAEIGTFILCKRQLGWNCKFYDLRKDAKYASFYVYYPSCVQLFSFPGAIIKGTPIW